MSDRPLILMVDDDKDLREIMKAKLEASGFSVAEAKNRDDAMEQLKKIVPALVLMDINMPGVQGTEVVLELKQNDATKDIKVAFLTSLKDPWPGFEGDPQNVARELGAVGFLQKTDDLDALVGEISRIVGISSPA